MEERDVLAYVRAAALALDIPLDTARAEAVALHLGRTVLIARALENAPLAHAVELAEIFRPAPFPAKDET